MDVFLCCISPAPSAWRPVAGLTPAQHADGWPAVGAADIISAIEFDGSGQHLATGDRGGRVVLFERVASPQVLVHAMRSPLQRRLLSLHGAF